MRAARIKAFSLATAIVAAGFLAAPPVRAEAAAVPDSAAEVRPLLIGAAAPSAVLHTPDGAEFDLKSAIEKKPTIVIFYRGGW